MPNLTVTVVKGDVLGTTAIRSDTHAATLTKVTHEDEPEVGEEDILTFVVSRSGYTLTL